MTPKPNEAMLTRLKLADANRAVERAKAGSEPIITSETRYWVEARFEDVDDEVNIWGRGLSPYATEADARVWLEKISSRKGVVSRLVRETLTCEVIE